MEPFECIDGRSSVYLIHAMRREPGLAIEHRELIESDAVDGVRPQHPFGELQGRIRRLWGRAGVDHEMLEP